MLNLVLCIPCVGWLSRKVIIRILAEMNLKTTRFTGILVIKSADSAAMQTYQGRHIHVYCILYIHVYVQLREHD